MNRFCTFCSWATNNTVREITSTSHFRFWLWSNTVYCLIHNRVLFLFGHVTYFLITSKIRSYTWALASSAQMKSMWLYSGLTTSMFAIRLGSFSLSSATSWNTMSCCDSQKTDWRQWIEYVSSNGCFVSKYWTDTTLNRS